MKQPLACNFDADDLARLTLRTHFERAATHFAIRSELLACNARIQHKFKGCSAKGTLNSYATFHVLAMNGLPQQGVFSRGSWHDFTEFLWIDHPQYLN